MEYHNMYSLTAQNYSKNTVFSKDILEKIRKEQGATYGVIFGELESGGVTKSLERNEA